MSKINSLICQIFEPDKNGDITVENILKTLAFVIMCLITTIAFFYGWSLWLFLDVCIWNLNIFQETCWVFAPIGTVILIIFILGYIFINIKSKTVAHCQVKKEEDGKK
jgi:hypothetical protein